MKILRSTIQKEFLSVGQVVIGQEERYEYPSQNNRLHKNVKMLAR